MQKIFPENLKNEIKAIGIYEILGGITGLIILLIGLLNQSPPVLIILLYIFGFSLFSYSIICGVLQLKMNKNAFKYSFINQFLQLISFALFGYVFEYAAGAYLMIGVNFTHDNLFNFKLGLSTWTTSINTNDELMEINLNIVAMIMITLLEKTKKKLEKYHSENGIADFGNTEITPDNAHDN